MANQYKLVPISGSFMDIISATKWLSMNGHSDFIYRIRDIQIVDGEKYLPTDLIQSQLTAQEWREMQSKVTTLVLGLEPILNTGSVELTETEIFERFNFGDNQDRLHFVTREYED